MAEEQWSVVWRRWSCKSLGSCIDGLPRACSMWSRRRREDPRSPDTVEPTVACHWFAGNRQFDLAWKRHERWGRADRPSYGGRCTHVEGWMDDPWGSSWTVELWRTSQVNQVSWHTPSLTRCFICRISMIEGKFQVKYLPSRTVDDADSSLETHSTVGFHAQRLFVCRFPGHVSVHAGTG